MWESIKMFFAKLFNSELVKYLLAYEAGKKIGKNNPKLFNKVNRYYSDIQNVDKLAQGEVDKLFTGLDDVERELLKEVLVVNIEAPEFNLPDFKGSLKYFLKGMEA